MKFVWDPVKAEANLKKHGVSFEDGATVFRDFYAIEFFDDEHSTALEYRYERLGLSKFGILVVIYTVVDADISDDTIIIISVRPAAKVEEADYLEQRHEK